ncbi:phosphatase PAP2 family protein [Pontibacter sp. 13R65]|uniref:phosphatase PAP2 family protein n=1 Tax=Pontibacter sp. 13R65 TaxID=3127458 RepID=UPI00301B815C
MWLLLLPALVLAQKQEKPDSLQEASLQSYYLQPDQQPYLKPMALVVGGTGLWALTYAIFDEPLQDLSQNNRSLVADYTATVVEPLGRQKYMAPLAGAALASGVLLKDKKLTKFGTIALGSLLSNAVITGTLKNSFSRHRPSSSTENHMFDGMVTKSHHSSLPSSHTSTAFAFATSLATVYGHKKYVPPVAYGVATLVGLSRVYDNAHWATDVLAGAAVGYLSAKGVSLLYQYTEKKLSQRKQRLYLVPMMSPYANGLCTVLTF